MTCTLCCLPVKAVIQPSLTCCQLCLQIEDDIDMDFDPPGSAMGGDSNPTFGNAEPSEQNGNAEQQEYGQQANAAQEQELYSPGPSLDYSPLPNQDPGETCGLAMTWWTHWLVRICLYVESGVSACCCSFHHCHSASLPCFSCCYAVSLPDIHFVVSVEYRLLNVCLNGQQYQLHDQREGYLHRKVPNLKTLFGLRKYMLF